MAVMRILVQEDNSIISMVNKGGFVMYHAHHYKYKIMLILLSFSLASITPGLTVDGLAQGVIESSPEQCSPDVPCEPKMSNVMIPVPSQDVLLKCTWFTEMQYIWESCHSTNTEKEKHLVILELFQKILVRSFLLKL